MAEYKCPYCQKLWKYKKAFTKHSLKCKMKEVIEQSEQDNIINEPEPDDLESIIKKHNDMSIKRNDSILSFNGNSSYILDSISDKSIQTIFANKIIDREI